MAEQRQGDQLEHAYSNSVDTRCSLGDLPEVMDDRVRNTRADSAT